MKLLFMVILVKNNKKIIKINIVYEPAWVIKNKDEVRLHLCTIANSNPDIQHGCYDGKIKNFLVIKFCNAFWL